MTSQNYSSGRILIVDDEEANVLVLERMLARAGYTRVVSTQDSRQALPLFRDHQPDLVLLDLLMPHLDGYAVLEQINAELPANSFVPVMVLTADARREALTRALSAGAKDFLTKPFDQTELLLRVKNLLETRALYLSLQRQLAGMESLYEQAQRAIVMRDESLSSISHDIGQPLAAIRLTTELLQQEVREQPDVKRLQQLAEELNRIDRAANQMADMIAELADIARLQMGRDLTLHYLSLDLAALLKDLVDQHRQTSRRKLKLASPAKLVAELDKVRITRVLSNLLSNAIKYSPRNSEIEIELSEESLDGIDYARIVVRDHGIGIPASDLPHIFERFYRAGNVSNVAAGSGIGLSGVKQIVEQHGGQIDLESREGQGTTATVRLPVRKP